MKRKLQTSLKSEYTRVNIIAEGAYGIVYEAKDNKTGKKVAIKKFKKKFLSNGVPVSALRECSILKKVHHPNVVKYLFIF